MIYYLRVHVEDDATLTADDDDISERADSPGLTPHGRGYQPSIDLTRFQKLIESEEGKSSHGAGAEDQARRTGMTQTQHTTHATIDYNKVAEMLESGRTSRNEVQANDSHARQERHGKKQSNRHSRQPDIVDPQSVTHRTTRLHVEHVNVPYGSSASSRHHHHGSTSGWPEVQSGAWAVQEELGEHLPCLLYTSPSPRDATLSRMPSSA